MKRTTPQSVSKMEVKKPTSCAEISDVPFTRDSICLGDLSKCVYSSDLGKSTDSDCRHPLGARAAHRHCGLAPDGARRTDRLQSLSSGFESRPMVATETEPLTAPSTVQSLCRGWRQFGLRHRRDARTSMGPEDSKTGTFSR